MNRRQFDREPTNLELYAQSGEQRPRRLKATNISSRGVFVENWSPPPQDGARVDLVFLIGAGAVVRLLRRSARVARVVDGGVGLIHGAEAECSAVAPPSPSPWSSLRWPDFD